MEGLGLSPLLLNPRVYPHPLATFLSHALIAVAAILSMVGSPLSKPIASLSWATLTLAPLFGGLWSYETLGWGGYRAWDPVEVAQLIPWLILTSALHSISLSRRLFEVLLALGLSSIYYGFLVVRTGLSPLHSFASPQAYTAYISVLAIAIIVVIAAYRAHGVTLEARGLTGYAMIASIIPPLLFSISACRSVNSISTSKPSWARASESSSLRFRC